MIFRLDYINIRTFYGFQNLFEQHWINFGHNFSIQKINNFHSKYIVGENNSILLPSYIFTLWIDCIHNLMKQFPTSFEFNEHFLINLLDQSHSNLYGEFLFHTSYQKLQNSYIYSIWDDIQKNINHYINPLYQLNKKSIIPFIKVFKLKFWDHYYLRWNNNNNNYNNYNSLLNENSIVTLTENNCHHCIELKSQISSLLIGIQNLKEELEMKKNEVQLLKNNANNNNLDIIPINKNKNINNNNYSNNLMNNSNNQNNNIMKEEEKKNFAIKKNYSSSISKFYSSLSKKKDLFIYKNE